jgi:hypothetical protein
MDIMDDWSLREAIYKASHRWPLMLAFILAGSLLGLLLAFVWPSPYRATTELYVGLDPYRAVEDQSVAAFAQTDFRNADDYKYWQMEQLNGLAFFDDYLSETLSRLRDENEYWNRIEVSELRNMLSLYWRNAGQWRLVAETTDPKHAEQAVSVWREVILDKTTRSIANSKDLFLLDLELQKIKESQERSGQRQADLATIKGTLLSWRSEVSERPPSQSLEDLERWQLWNLAARAAAPGQDWQTVLDEIPARGSSAQDYVPWIDQLLGTIDSETRTLESLIENLAERQAQITDQWEEALGNGQGLAATLQIEKPSNSLPEVHRVRRTGSAILVGGGLGFIVFALMVLADVSKRGGA